MNFFPETSFKRTRQLQKASNCTNRKSFPESPDSTCSHPKLQDMRNDHRKTSLKNVQLKSRFQAQTSFQSGLTRPSIEKTKTPQKLNQLNKHVTPPTAISNAYLYYLVPYLIHHLRFLLKYKKNISNGTHKGSDPIHTS